MVIKCQKKKPYVFFVSPSKIKRIILTVLDQMTVLLIATEAKFPILIQETDADTKTNILHNELQEENNHDEEENDFDEETFF